MIPKKIMLWLLPLLAIAAFVLIMMKGHGEDKAVAWQHDEGFIFGTVYNITYHHSEDLQTEIEAELMKVDREFSMFNSESTVARINRGDSLVERSEMFNEVYALAMKVNADTQGAFDITVAPLVNAWGFGFKHEQMPTPEQVDSLLQIHSQLDFAAIAKGYGCDVVASLLESRGINDYMVEIGGEIAIHGMNHKREPWRVGVNKPVDDSLSVSGELHAVLKLSDVCLATSGNYRNFYYKGGRKYAHTIDPRTGYPVQHEVLSATVLADNCATADAYATAFMVLGLDSTRSVLERHPEMKAYLIYTDQDDDYAVWHSPGLDIEK